MGKFDDWDETTLVKVPEEEQAASVLDALIGGLREKGQEGPVNPPSEKQVTYLESLIADKVCPAVDVVFGKGTDKEYMIPLEDLNRNDIQAMERPDVSSFISMLVQAQRKDSGKGRASWDNVPEGRYALEWSTSGVDAEDSGWVFYQVDKPTEGRWAGYVFVNRLVGAPGDYRRIKVGRGESIKVLKDINRNPKQAMIDYGLHSGVCGRCGSPLTDPESRRRGLGPICAGKSGWF